MAETTTTTEKASSDDDDIGDKIKQWLAVEANFVTLMIIVVAVLCIFGVALFICICRYPSYDYPENMRRKIGGDKKKRKRNSENDVETISEAVENDNVGKLERLPFNDPSFRKIGSTPSYRLPTPGDADPHGRLPPLNAPRLTEDVLVLDDSFDATPRGSGRGNKHKRSIDSAVLDDLNDRIARF